MRILLLVHYYFPNTQSCVTLFHDLATELVELGHEVTLAAPDASLDAPLTVRREHGLTTVRVRSRPFQGVSHARRAWNEWRLPRAMWRSAGEHFRDNPCDLIISMSPTIFFGPLVARLKALWDCRNYLILRDIFPQWAADSGLFPQDGMIFRFFRRYELLLYDTADVIGVASARNLAHFAVPELRDRHHLTVLPNWASTSGRPVSATNYREELGLQGRVVFLYGGRIGLAQDISAILRLADAMRDDPHAFFLIVGDGSEAGRIRDEARARRLDNLRLLPPLPFADYMGMVAEFDVGMISLNPRLRSHNHPSKMFDYMYFGKPILAALNHGNDLRDDIERHEAGLACSSDEPEQLIANARRLAANKDERRRFGSNSRALLDNVFSARHAARRILADA